jgi:hypothetical protein
MPCTPDRSLLFIHIPKTGGSSIENAFGFYGPWEQENQDILFGLIRSPELISYKWGSAFLQHLTWQEIQQNWDLSSAMRFAAVRNPWARFASVYTNTDTHLKETAMVAGINLDNLTFDQFVDATDGFAHAHLRPQLEYITMNNIVDKSIIILHTENLENEFKQLCNQLGHQHHLAWHHTSSKKIPFKQLYSPTSWRRIADRYAMDIDYFGYSD